MYMYVHVCTLKMCSHQDFITMQYMLFTSWYMQQELLDWHVSIIFKTFAIYA